MFQGYALDRCCFKTNKFNMAFLTLYFELKAYWAVTLLALALNLLFVVGGSQEGKSVKWLEYLAAIVILLLESNVFVLINNRD